MIYGKCGGLGDGKSMRMVVDGLELVIQRGAKEGRCWLAANMLVNVPEGVKFFLLPMDGFSAALAALMAHALDEGVGLVVLVDEIDTVWDARDWQNMRRSDRYRIKQSRKYGVDFFYSAQFLDQVEKSIRNVTTEVELVRAYPRPTLARRDHRDKNGEAAPKRPWLIRGQRFRPAAVREITGAPDKEKRLGSAWHRYRRDHELLYDTDEIIIPVDTEALCARHKREEAEARCPRCNATGHGDGLDPMQWLVEAASDGERPATAA